MESIPIDADFAGRSPMSGIIAHGTMSPNLPWQSIDATLGGDAPHRATLDVRFVRPVRIGDTVTAGGRRREDTPAFWDVWVWNAAGEPVIAGTATLAPPPRRHPRRAARPARPQASSPTFSTSLPKFSPWNSFSSVSGKVSIPSTTSSRDMNRPSPIHCAMSRTASP